MKSGYKIAKEAGVTPQALYRRLTPGLLSELKQHYVSKPNGGYLFDDVAEARIKELFSKGGESPGTFVEQSIPDEIEQPGINAVEQINELLRGEIEYLRDALDAAQEELRLERQHNRDITEKLAEMNQNSQMLLGVVQPGVFRRLISGLKRKPLPPEESS